MTEIPTGGTSSVTVGELRESPWLERLEAASLDGLARAAERVELSAGSYLFRLGEAVDAVYTVLSGELEVVDHDAARGDTVISTIAAGAPVGEFQILLGGTRSFTVRAASPAVLARWMRGDFVTLVERFREIAAAITRSSLRRIRRNRLRATLPKLLGTVDDSLLSEIEKHGRWRQLEAGDSLYRRGDVADELSILVSGRLRVGEPPRIVAEVTPGEAIGEMSLFLTGQPRSATVQAVRESDVVTLSRQAVDRIGEEYPQLVKGLAALLARRLIRVDAGETRRSGLAQNLAVVPLADAVPTGEFCQRISRALSRYGSVLQLDSDRLSSLVGIEGAADLTPANPLNLRLATWLEEREDEHDLIVYRADAAATPWTRRCLGQADHVLLVGQGGEAPGLTALEEALTRASGNPLVRHSLVLLHPDRRELPRGTRHWLSARRVDAHHHVCLDRDADFERLARRVLGRAIGAVFSGGGVRTTAQLGVLAALEEMDVPIDMVGGTSGGGHVALQHAMGRSVSKIVELTRYGFLEAKLLRDLTLPWTSFLGGRKVDSLGEVAFGDRDIEDLWLPAYSISCNLSTGETVTHSTGSVLEAAAATFAIPVIWPPRVYGGSLLVDGGVVMNMPVAPMREGGAAVIVGCDVSPQEELRVDLLQGRLPSGWRLLWSRLWPFRPALRAPSIMDVIMRLVTLNDTKERERAWQQCDLLLRPPVEKFGMLDVRAIDDMIEIGRRHTLEALASIDAENPLAEWVGGGRGERAERAE